MADPSAKPPAYPPAVEPDEGEEEEPKSTLPPEIAEKEAQRAIEEIEEEIEEERPRKRSAAAEHVAAESETRTFLDRAWETQYKLESRFQRIGHGKYSRVVKMARKPSPDEFAKAVKITALGIAIVGFIGFVILIFMGWLTESVLGVK